MSALVGWIFFPTVENMLINGNGNVQHNFSHNIISQTRVSHDWGRKILVSMPIKKPDQLTHWSVITGNTCGKSKEIMLMVLFTLKNQKTKHQHLSHWSPVHSLISSSYCIALKRTWPLRLLLMIITGLPATKCQPNQNSIEKILSSAVSFIFSINRVFLSHLLLAYVHRFSISSLNEWINTSNIIYKC